MLVDNQFQIMANSIPSLLWVSDAIGIRYFFNHSWRESTGYIDNHSDGNDWKICIQADDWTRYYELFTLAFNQRSASRLKYRLKNKEGKCFWVLETAIPRYSTNGTFLGYIGTCTDIHSLMDSKIIVKELAGLKSARNHYARFFKKRLGIAFDSADLGYFYIHASDRKLFGNNARFKQFFGFGPDDNFSYDDAINQIHPEYRQVVYEAVEAAIAKGTRFDMEYPITGRNGERTCWVHGIGNMHYDKEGMNSYFIAAFYEITEKKQNEIRKNDFISIVSHELKTPLSALSAILQTVAIQLKNSKDDYIRNAFSKSMSQIKKMTNLIDGFLEIPRLDAGKIRLDRSDFDIVELIQEQIRETELTISSHHIQFSACESLFLNADYNKIGYVISNLIRNAAKYSTPGKLIAINCHLAGEMIQISVIDEGIGIEPQDKEKLFERYYRAENSFTRHTAGSGIGLYLCAEIIQRHEGKIWVDSQPGVGSTFFFSLPTQTPQLTDIQK